MAVRIRIIASTPKRLPTSCAPTSSHPLTSIPQPNGPCVHSCASASSTSGAAPNCSTAYNRTPAKQTRRVRDSWEEQLLKAENHPLRQLALKNDMAMIRHFDTQVFQLEEELQRQTKRIACREFTLLKSIPGIGEVLELTILHEIGDIERFPSIKDFLSYCRLVKGTVASAGKIKGLRGAKLGNPYLRWAFGEAAVIAKRDHYHLKPLAQQL